MIAGALAMAAVSAVAVVAADDVPTFALNGFVSQGWLRSGGNAYIPGSDDDGGSFSFAEAAIAVTADPADRLRIGAQLFTRRFGDVETNDQVVLDWAYGDYRIADALGVRLGKIKHPRGFYNEIQDIDAARTAILLPQSVYDTHLRDFWTSVTGGGGYGTLVAGPVGSFEWQAWYGGVDIEDNGTTADYYGGPDATDSDQTIDRVWGGQVIWNLPVIAARLGASFSRFPEITDVIRSSNPVSARTVVIEDQECWVLSADWRWRDLQLVAEWARTTNEAVARFANIPLVTRFEGDSEGWFVQASYRLHPRAEVGSYYSLYWFDHDRQGRAGKGSYQEDIALSLLVEPTSWWTVKAEGHLISGVGLLSYFERADAERDWWLLALKTTFTF